MILLTPAVFLVFMFLTRPKGVDFDVMYTNTVAPWRQKTYVSLKPYEGEISTRLGALKIENSELLNPIQETLLRSNILTWFKAYSKGTKEAYLAFRLPPGVPWRWRSNSVSTLSNYFDKGIVFDTPDMMDSWMRKYGDPNRIAEMPTFAAAAQKWSAQKAEEVKRKWIATYGDGSAARKAYRPTDPVEQWLTIANEHAATNWWLDYWTGVCMDEMIVRITTYDAKPDELYLYKFGPVHTRTGYDVTANFPNMGIGRLARRSYLEWNFTYDDVLKRSGKILTANIYAMFERSKEVPQPALLRLVFMEQYGKWVPFEMVDGNIMKGTDANLFY